MTKKQLFLSHFINEATPQYGGADNISIKDDSRIIDGKSSNTKHLSFSNHIGTHIDFPHHFSDTGKTINNYPPSFWTFNKPFVVEYSAQDDEILSLENLLGHIPEDTDFLIIKTGFQKYRTENKYWNNNPGIHPNMAAMLKEQCPNIKAIGFDFISITSYQNRKLGRIAHKSFLVDNDILIVEDMNLSSVQGQLQQLICLPLLINETDGSPITIIGKIN
jgi:arylformamidase